MVCTSFSTKGVAGSRGRHAYQEAMSNVFSLGLDIVAPAECPFETEMTGFASAKLRMASLRFSPHVTTRRATSDAREKCCFILGLQRAGTTYVTQDGRTARIEPGDLFLIDTGRPFKLETGEIWTESFYIPGEAIRAAFWQVDSLTAVRIPADAGAAAMLRGMFRELFELAPNLANEAEARVLTCAMHVVELALTAISGELQAAPSNLDRYHRERIRRFIRDGLRDPELSPKVIAAGVGLSVRHLYELYSGEGETLMKGVWNERLAHCRDDLASVTHHRRTIAEIAQSWGFSDAAHFSRAFHERFGESPSTYRRGALGARTRGRRYGSGIGSGGDTGPGPAAVPLAAAGR
jgi:AraC-like DNA-binding protein